MGGAQSESKIDNRKLLHWKPGEIEKQELEGNIKYKSILFYTTLSVHPCKPSATAAAIQFVSPFVVGAAMGPKL